jgi:hypothetical protein
VTAQGPRPTLARILVGGVRNRRAARAPFVLLVVALLAGGLFSLLLLNASVNQGAFQLSKLKKQTTQYTDEDQELQQEVDQDSAPGSLARKAHRLGMVPGGNPAFLRPGGQVRGVPGSASAPPPPPPSTAPATPSAPPSTGTPAPPGSAAPSIGPNTGR